MRTRAHGKRVAIGTWRGFLTRSRRLLIRNWRFNRRPKSRLFWLNGGSVRLVTDPRNVRKTFKLLHAMPRSIPRARVGWEEKHWLDHPSSARLVLSCLLLLPLLPWDVMLHIVKHAEVSLRALREFSAFHLIFLCYIALDLLSFAVNFKGD